MISLIVLTDGRQHCLSRTMASLFAAVDLYHVTERHIINDCPDPAFGEWLRQYERSGFTIHPPEAQRRGFGGAIRKAWSVVGDNPWIFHLEDDFMFNRKVDLVSLCRVLEANPHLVQLVMRRNAWSPEEIAAGGLLEMWPDEYVERQMGEDLSWVEHTLYFSTNPSVYRRSLLSVGWPDGTNSERKFTDRLLTDGSPEVGPDDVRFAFWGKRADDPLVTHIGEERVGVEY